MKKNMGGLDRGIRLVAAALLSYFTFTGLIPSPMAWLGYTVAIVFTATSLISFCPLYTLFGISTCPKA